MNGNIFFRATEEERELIKARANKAGYKNVTAYLKKMALEGMNVKVSIDMSGIKEIGRLISTATNNINQLARKANETNSIYEQDVKQLMKEVTELRNRISMLEIGIHDRLKQQSDKITRMIKKSGM